MTQQIVPLMLGQLVSIDDTNHKLGVDATVTATIDTTGLATSTTGAFPGGDALSVFGFAREGVLALGDDRFCLRSEAFASHSSPHSISVSSGRIIGLFPGPCFRDLNTGPTAVESDAFSLLPISLLACWSSKSTSFRNLFSASSIVWK